MKSPLRKPSAEDRAQECAAELRLVHAEARAASLFDKAMALHTIVTRRDQANHWQESVNRLFSGGT